jgi:hypothetical protein
MSTLGAADRSSRAPATPSSTQRNDVPSNCTEKHVSTASPMFCGRVQVFPPSEDLTMIWEPWPGIPTANWFANTYTTPWLSVRTVHPERPNPCLVLNGLLLAEVTCFEVHVDPPSVDGGHDQWLRRRHALAQAPEGGQADVDVPKKGLLAALSAQIWSLSLNVVDDCLVAITGACQAL